MEVRHNWSKHNILSDSPSTKQHISLTHKKEVLSLPLQYRLFRRHGDPRMACSCREITHCLIIIIMYLSWSWATYRPVPVSRIQKSLQKSAMIFSASRGVVFHYPG